MGTSTKTVILDTNVIISALLWKGVTREIFNLASSNQIQIYTSNLILQEVYRVLSYVRMKPFIEKENVPLEEIINRFKILAKVIDDMYLLDVVKDDPSDNIILSCALSAKADFIVSGDKHLLNLKSFLGTPIVKPNEFLRIIKDL